jgi:hypothetical protein
VEQLNLDSIRARRARLSARVGKLGFEIMVAASWLFAVLAIINFFNNGTQAHAGFASISLTKNSTAGTRQNIR